ncbi:reverse transcriptase [Tanacetum coccineum]|uniref:Reverse transcriptase n=1 Tax=Tanacetum coccineum TaxID=301880 RepID=A0ABQ4Z7G1_9ASTR
MEILLEPTSNKLTVDPHGFEGYLGEGVGRPLKVSNLRELCRAHRPNVVFLMEMKNKERYLESLRRSLPFTGFFYVNPIGRLGGLALWWKDSITLNNANGNKNIILVDGICLAPFVSWRACFIYGPHNRRDRKLLWQKISHFALSATCPFFVIGDFNLIVVVADKHGGSSNTSSQIKEFQSLLSALELFELPFKGLNYTWDNNRAENANIWGRIHRSLANETLLVTFPI